MLIPVFVVVVVEARYLEAQIAFDVPMRLRYQPALCILDSLLPCTRVVAFDNPFHCSYCRTIAAQRFFGTASRLPPAREICPKPALTARRANNLALGKCTY
jgi:hypothetical protein